MTELFYEHGFVSHHMPMLHQRNIYHSEVSAMLLWCYFQICYIRDGSHLDHHFGAAHPLHDVT